MNHFSRRRRPSFTLSHLFIAIALLVPMLLAISSVTSAQEGERTGDPPAAGPGLASGVFPAASTDAVALAESLVGAGEPIDTFNETLVSTNDSAGSFTADPGVIGFDAGILLTTGNVNLAAGPNGSDATTVENGLAGDADLTGLAGFATFDATILEFDFNVNFGQTVSFNYVFGSEEYNEFVNTEFNDVFAFYVNGVNCATVGGNNVTVNEINQGNPLSLNGGNPTQTNPGLFRPNQVPIAAPNTIDTGLDGLTVVLSCDAAIVDGNNHMKLAIADASDRRLDAAVFIEAGSLTVNTAPTAVDDAASTPKNVAVNIDVLANDTDPDATDTLSVVNVSDPANGSVVNNGDGTVTYTPDAAFVGTDTFTYQVNDGLENSNTATVTVEVFNRPPDAVDDFFQTFKHTTATHDVLTNDSDPDGDPLTISLFDAASTLGGTITDNGDGTLEYTSPNVSGFDTYTYTITDNDPIDPLTDTATVTIEIINQPPVCDAAAPSIALLWPPNHKFVDIEILGVVDPDGDPFTITIDSIFQDEPVNTQGDGNTGPDATGVGTSTASVLAERSGSPQVPGNGRVYHISFTATDVEGATCSGTVTVGVPHDQGGQAVPVDDGALFDSTVG